MLFIVNDVHKWKKKKKDDVDDDNDVGTAAHKLVSVFYQNIHAESQF
jgi:hypothetical protein